MNKDGGGITSLNSWRSEEIRIFRGGLRNVPNGFAMLETGKGTNVHNSHDNFSYRRGTVRHARSLFTQKFAYHFMFGGYRDYIFNRWAIMAVCREKGYGVV